MTFDLKIQFVGLCMFVPDPDGSAMHVLMPTSAGSGGPHGSADVPAHVAMLCFDPGYLQRNGSRWPGAAVNAVVDQATLAVAGSGTLDLALPESVAVNVARVTRSSVIPSLLAPGDPGTALAARVRLESGKMTGYAPGVCWNYDSPPDDPRPLPNRVCWTVPMEGKQVDLVLRPFKGERDTPLPALYPIDGAVEVWVYNTPRHELPPSPLHDSRPEHGQPAHHFVEYYKLLQNPAATPPPTFHSDRCTGGGGGNRLADVDGFGGSAYTCMVAQAKPEM